MKFAFIVTGSIFLQLYCVSDNVATTPYALKWDVKNGIAFLLQFFSLISDGLGGVRVIEDKINTKYASDSYFVYALRMEYG